MRCLDSALLPICIALWVGSASGQNVSSPQEIRGSETASNVGGTRAMYMHGTMTRSVYGQQLGYQIIYPATKSSSDHGYPVLLFLHGAGERGTNISLVSAHGPPKILAASKQKGHPLRQAVVISPQCPKGEWWQSGTLVALLKEIIHSTPLKIDQRRIYVSGLSMGGFGVWGLIKDYPDLFAAAVPVCGGYDVSKIRTPLGLSDPNSFSFDAKEVVSARSVPVWATHGAEDRIVLPIQTQQLVVYMKQAGNQRVHWIEYPGVGHDSWSRTYSDPKMYEWLFEQSRAKPAAFGRKRNR